MKLNFPPNVKTTDLVKRMMYLAWQASGCVGYGCLQDRGSNQTEQQVWDSMYNRDDYPDGNAFPSNSRGDVYADYVRGRMMKVGFKWTDDSVENNGDNWYRGYQSFCHKYPDVQALCDAAVKSFQSDHCDVPVESLK